MTERMLPAVEPAVAEIAAIWDATVDGTPAERREGLARHMATQLSRLGWPDGWRTEVDIERHIVPRGDRGVPVRVYSPRRGAPRRGALVFMFGGAWWLRGFDAPDVTHLCGTTAVAAGYDVVEVDYALAPEHPFPTALDDVVAVLEWVAAGGLGRQVPDGRLAIGGISAGANLAAAACLRIRDQGGPAIALQILEVPLLDVTSKDDEFVDFYLQGHDPRDPLVSPLLAPSLAGLPPALILTAELDAFAPEGRAYGNALRAAGVDAVSVVFDGQAHLSPCLWPVTPSARAWRRMVATELRELRVAEA